MRFRMSASRSLRHAIEQGELTEEQLRELITLDAEILGLNIDDAIRLARARRLPKSYVGADLELLVGLLSAPLPVGGKSILNADLFRPGAVD